MFVRHSYYKATYPRRSQLPASETQTFHANNGGGHQTAVLNDDVDDDENYTALVITFTSAVMGAEFFSTEVLMVTLEVHRCEQNIAQAHSVDDAAPFPVLMLALTALYFRPAKHNVPTAVLIQHPVLD